MGSGAAQVEASMLPGINGGYVTYRVDTSTTLPGFAQPEMSVRRRFREFVVRWTTLDQFHGMALCSGLCHPPWHAMSTTVKVGPCVDWHLLMLFM